MTYERLASGMISRPNADGSESYIPPDETNSDYRAYLAWVAAGNVAPVRSEPVAVVQGPTTEDQITALQQAVLSLALGV